ncbi:MAG TPA: GNAT family N-acyltransferase [Alphaproteobacteria bacterium]|nr:GNAT family N-acetyltransferase [Alphaproteobacteria bacterium]USO06209.1 MAG: GNAT family N-acetyltransferase [Rhodospirillales bacterium]HOO82291.1 GNAT family N-acyltransferase [Alphaproteobacteria bacterium]
MFTKSSLSSVGNTFAAPLSNTGAAISKPLSLYQKFHDNFSIILADTPELRKDAMRIRYLAYCVENPFENPEDNLEGLEQDVYDEKAHMALVRHNKSGINIGTTRLIVKDEKHALPIEGVVHDEVVKSVKHMSYNVGEISRFCIAQTRKKKIDDDSAILNLGFLGIVAGSFMLCRTHNITHWVGAMEPFLFKKLEMIGLKMDYVGETFLYHGERRPFFSDISNILEKMSYTHNDVWHLMAR